MKNNTILLFLILIFGFGINNQVSSEEFIFESSYLEVKDNGNIIEAKNGVTVKSKNNIEITAKNSFYNRSNLNLLLQKKVELYDKERNIKITSEEINYNKNIEEIKSNGKTYVYLTDGYTIITENLKYSKKDNIIQSKFKTTLIDKFGNEITATNFKYLVNKKLFHGNNINMIDANQNNYFFEQTMIDLKKNKILAKDIEINFAKNTFGNSDNDPRLRGSALYSNNEESIIKNGIFTSCKINDTCPPWSIKSSEIRHDKIKKTINYEKAWLQIYDKPVLYFPKFFHPDPSVKRQSGFLMPGILNSSTSGSLLKIPYYKVLSENKDLTLTPRLYFNGDVMVQNEFRQVEKNYENIFDFSAKKMSGTSKSHFFSNSKIDMNLINFDYSDLEFNLERTSNDTYLKTDDIKSAKTSSDTVMNNFLNFSASKEDLDISLNFRVYEDLSKVNQEDKFEYIYPNFTVTKILETSFDSFGSFDYQVSGFQKKYNTNITEKLFINDFSFLSKPFFSNLGFKNDYQWFFKNSNKEGKNSPTYKNDITSNMYSALIFNSYYPLSKETSHYEKEFVPKISLRMSPNSSEILTNLDRRINTTNIFSSNRLGLTDSIEGGQSLTVGTEYNLNKKSGFNIFKINLAQIFRDIDDKNLPIKSRMNNKKSDLVGDLRFNPNDYLNFEYDFSLDNDLETPNYHMVNSTLSINNFVTTFEFLEENNDIGSKSYLANETSYALSDSSKVLFRERRNRETKLKEFYNIMYQYENDCLVAALEYNKNYYTDRDLKPSEELFFSITIVPVSKFSTPSISK